MMSGASIIPYSPRAKKTPTSAVVDTSNDAVKPLDYSFYKMVSVEDMIAECPREVGLKKGDAPRIVDETHKSNSQCLRLNNNKLTSISLLKDVATKLLANPAALAWIDLSFNNLSTIDPILLDYENLEILYLHGNAITKLQEINKLEGLKHLRKLTLHGNPIEEIKGYKQYILSLMPTLLSLDFFRITKADLRTSETWYKMNSATKSKKKDTDAD